MSIRSRTLPILLVVPLLSIGGCEPSPAPLDDNFDDSVTWSTSGCSDVIIFSHDPDDTVALFFRSEGQVADAFAAGETKTYELQLGVDATVEVQQGEQLTKETCNDVIEMDDRPVVKRTYNAISGTATLTVEPGASEWDAHGTLILNNVVLTAPDDPELLIEAFGPVSASVGWLPG